MKINILTIFPHMFKGPFNESILRRAQDKNLVKIKVQDLRDWTEDKHKSVDHRPYGGGKGMVLMIEPIYKALQDLKPKNKNLKYKVILLSPQGKVFNQSIAENLSKLDQITLLCGHYEGVDERVKRHLIDEEISIGDYVLTGGEIPAMVLTDTTVRLIPGVLDKKAVDKDSFSKKLLDSKQQVLEYPHYTRPAEFKSWKVPEILLSGDHKKIEQWRQEQAIKKTKKQRPDLLKSKKEKKQ
jgi:tRNA (guanine37-N1)-methyltransferase